jgi:hypothetical protein
MNQVDHTITIVLAIAALGVLYVFVPIAADAYRRFRSPRTVTCPETSAPADVQIDGVHAAITALDGPPLLEVKRCSRWPEHRHCGQACLEQIDAQGPAPRTVERKAAA